MRRRRRIDARARRHSRGFLLVLLGLCPAVHAVDIEQGREIYLHGRLRSGAPVTARVQGDVPASGEAVACVNCHRRSGQGSNEGRSVAPPVTAEALFQPRKLPIRRVFSSKSLAATERSAYRRETLFRAIREGRNPDGRTLSPLMPRYRLDDAQLDDLLAYLSTLSSHVSPGVTRTEIRLATVLADGAPKRAAETMLAVLNTYVDTLNAETRYESLRATHPPVHKHWQYGHYRHFRLLVWRLHGPPATWREQLEHAYRRTPVFALVSGLTGGDWAPIHAFCEAQALPCLFPNTRLPVTDGAFYTLYFDRGIDLEADTLANHLLQSPDRGAILQVRDDSPIGRRAARRLAERLRSARPSVQIETLVIVPEEEQASDRLRTAVADRHPRHLVFWLQDGEASALLVAGLLPDLPQETGVHVDSALLRRLAHGPPASRSLSAPYCWRLPDPRDGQLLRVRLWAQRRGLDPDRLDLPTLADTYTALQLTADAIRHARGLLVRDYVIELLEHMVDNAIVTGMYPSFSLGPDQRFAAKGCRIVALDGPRGRLRPVTPLRTP